MFSIYITIVMNAIYNTIFVWYNRRVVLTVDKKKVRMRRDFTDYEDLVRIRLYFSKRPCCCPAASSRSC